MEKQELEAEVVVVDVRPVEGAPGELRVVSVQGRELEVTIDYVTVGEYRRGWWDPGLRYVGRYDHLDALVDALVDFLARPLSEWRNYSRWPFETCSMSPAELARSEQFFRAKVHGRELALPGGASFRLPSIYWRQIEIYGDFDMDRAVADQDAELAQDRSGKDTS